MRRYHPSTLYFPANKGKWYVRVTVPKALLAAYKTRQLARSTGTADRTEARMRQHEITANIYSEFDRQFDKLGETLAKNDFQAFGEAMGVDAEQRVGLAKLEADAQYVLSNRDRYSPDQVEAAFNFVNVDHEDYLDAGLGRKPRRSQIVSLIEKSLEGLTERQKTTKERRKALYEFNQFLSFPFLNDIKKHDAYRYASHLQEQGASNSTIKKKIGFVRQFLGGMEREGLLNANPFQNLQLSKYGKTTDHYIPFSKSQLHALFQLDMPPEIRLAFTILLTTGMRLDEMALLTFEDVKEDEGIRFFDLRGKDKVVKNIGSARMVPVHDKTFIPNGSGRIFPRWRADADGKAQGPASKELMRYIHQVRNDDRQVTHSLRGTLKDLLRDAGVSKEIHDFITGHGASDVAGTYGDGPSLEARYRAINAVQHPWL
ncbi:hypothetical protein HKCCSP123_03170 [Rhodobacterales bacterium HKCCSP123]|nr:hypothetical protein [Rhodobacterales bacterium HKCCSP123]